MDKRKSLKLHKRTQRSVRPLEIVQGDIHILDSLTPAHLRLHRHGMRHAPSGPSSIAHETRRDRHKCLAALALAVLLLNRHKADRKSPALAEPLDRVDQPLPRIRSQHEVRLQRVQSETLGDRFIGGRRGFGHHDRAGYRVGDLEQPWLMYVGEDILLVSRMSATVPTEELVMMSMDREA